MAPVTVAAKSSSTTKDENFNSHNTSSRKTTLASARPQEQALKCPRCDSQNTKFCYFNNYSLTQPRHFCKTCRRYWTKGGALRNVPIGGGCRKNKKSRLSSRLTVDLKDTNISSDIGGLKFFHGLTPAMDFQLGGLNSFPSILNSHSSSTGHFTQFSSFGAICSSPCFNLDPSSGSSASSLMGFSFPFSSIESLSSINQELHWKLQQQRMAMLFGTAPSTTTTTGENNQKEPILFHNLGNTTPRTDHCGVDISRKEGTNGSNLSTEWFFDSNPYATASGLTPTNNSCNDGTDQNHVKNNWDGMNQAWGNLSQYSSL